jgi:hypothetical protein
MRLPVGVEDVSGVALGLRCRGLTIAGGEDEECETSSELLAAVVLQREARAHEAQRGA